MGPNQLDSQIPLGDRRELCRREPLGAIPFGKFKEPPLAKAFEKSLVVGRIATFGENKTGDDKCNQTEVDDWDLHKPIVSGTARCVASKQS